MDVEIKQYSDFFSSWYGLKDGTLLDLSDSRGEMWVKVEGETMTADDYYAHRR